MASPDLVSVILPTRNRADMVLTAIRSVIDGSYEDFELLVVDDDSDDETEELVRALTDERVTYLRLRERVGAAQARNLGIERAQGTYIAFQDSDDTWTSDHLVVLLETIMNEPEVTAVAYGIARRGSGESTPGRADALRQGDLRSVLTRYNIVALPAAVVRRKALHAIGGFDPTLPRFQDWDLFLRIAKEHTFAFVDRVVLDVGHGSGRISTDPASYYEALDRIVDKHQDLFGEADPRYEVAYRMQLVRHGIRSRRPRSAARQGLRVVQRPRGLLGWMATRLAGHPSPIDRHADRT